MMESGIFVGAGSGENTDSIYDSPDIQGNGGCARESMYRKGSRKSVNKMSFLNGDTKKGAVGNGAIIGVNSSTAGLQYLGIEHRIQEMAEEEDNESAEKRKRHSLYKKSGLQIITDDVDENIQRGSQEVKPNFTHMETPSF
jgi:vacuolar-type H+-ATPase subunit F/Vma7